MPMQQLLAQIDASFADLKLSDDERRAFATALREANPPEDGLRRLRNAAFDTLRGTLQSPEQMGALKWLEGIVRTLDLTRAGEVIPEAHAHFSPGAACRTAIVQRLQQARGTADICVFTISDDSIAEAIVAAHRRGVAVRVVTDDDKALDAGSDVDWLRNAGVPLACDRSSAHMHHKFAVIDGRWLINGSYNWTRSAATTNEENLVVCNDPGLVHAFQGCFDMLWQRWAI
ncbi:phospholipase D-like domain-containing protein [Chitinolyticbacter albus]|uniref:phospholipase D-like domain-containing protein n=1 Tax=Chitinolyticbacter albus TaxID=2961951 RepID=UPI00210A147F|nr:phospholipase D-like domain-containing protein [Chitinolyticbacter albus]